MPLLSTSGAAETFRTSGEAAKVTTRFGVFVASREVAALVAEGENRYACSTSSRRSEPSAAQSTEWVSDAGSNCNSSFSVVAVSLRAAAGATGGVAGTVNENMVGGQYVHCAVLCAVSDVSVCLCDCVTPCQTLTPRKSTFRILKPALPNKNTQAWSSPALASFHRLLLGWWKALEAWLELLLLPFAWQSSQSVYHTVQREGTIVLV